MTADCVKPETGLSSPAMLPFYVMMIVVLILITFIPDIVMFVPDRLMG